MNIKTVLTLIMFFSALSLNGADKKRFTEEVSKLLDNPFFNTASASVVVYDLDNNKEVFAHESQKLKHPASNMKVLTTAAGLYFLGTDYIFSTTMAGTGKVQNRIYNGDIYFKGGFDPDFTSSDLDKFVNYLKSLDVKAVNGNIYADISAMDSLYWGKGWMWDDDPGSDFPYLTPLIINDNSVTVDYWPGKPGEPVNFEVIPYSGYFTFKNNSVTITGDSSDIDITRDWINRKNSFSIKGYLSSTGIRKDLQLNVYRPELYFTNLFIEKLHDEEIIFYGITDTAQSPYYAENFISVKRSYDDILDNLNKESDNLSAEMTLRALSLLTGKFPASAQNGIKMIDSLITLSGLDPEDYRIVDGSGVSHYNLVSTELLNSVLVYLFNNKPNLYLRLKLSLPLAGFDGTLERRMSGDSPAANRVYAKTGTLSGVSTLSGYAETLSGSNISFSIMIENFTGSSSKARFIQDKLCELITEFL